MIIVSLHVLSNIRTMKLRKMSWVGYVARIREILVWNLKGRVT